MTPAGAAKNHTCPLKAKPQCYKIGGKALKK